MAGKLTKGKLIAVIGDQVKITREILIQISTCPIPNRIKLLLGYMHWFSVRWYW